MPLDECPLCSSPLTGRNVAPCEQCGGEFESLDQFRTGEQTYHLVRVLNGKELVLCTGCMLNFGYIDPEFLGVPAGTPYGFESMEVLREITTPGARADQYCPECGYRLKFLRFVKDVRTHAAG